MIKLCMNFCDYYFWANMKFSSLQSKWSMYIFGILDLLANDSDKIDIDSKEFWTFAIYVLKHLCKRVSFYSLSVFLT